MAETIPGLIARVRSWWGDRCTHCGHRFRWRKDARHSFGNRDGKEVFHDPCMGYVIWRRKAEERLDMLALVCEVWGVTDRDVKGIVEMRAQNDLDQSARSDLAFRVFYDLAAIGGDPHGR
jgi:hypothetical protein